LAAYKDHPCCCQDRNYSSTIQTPRPHSATAVVLSEDEDHTVDIVPLSEGTSLQRHSVAARVVEGFHSFTCTPMRLSSNLVLMTDTRLDENTVAAAVRKCNTATADAILAVQQSKVK